MEFLAAHTLTSGNHQAESLGSLPTCTPIRCQYHRAGVCFIGVLTTRALRLVVEPRCSPIRSTAPDFDHLVIDEGHHLEDEATSQLGWAVTGRLRSRRLDTLVNSTWARAPCAPRWKCKGGAHAKLPGHGSLSAISGSDR